MCSSPKEGRTCKHTNKKVHIAYNQFVLAHVCCDFLGRCFRPRIFWIDFDVIFCCWLSMVLKSHNLLDISKSWSFMHSAIEGYSMISSTTGLFRSMEVCGFQVVLVQCSTGTEIDIMRLPFYVILHLYFGRPFSVPTLSLSTQVFANLGVWSLQLNGRGLLQHRELFMDMFGQELSLALGTWNSFLTHSFRKGNGESRVSQVPEDSRGVGWNILKCWKNGTWEIQYKWCDQDVNVWCSRNLRKEVKLFGSS